MSNRMSNQQDSFARHGAAEARVRVVNEASANASGRYVLVWASELQDGSDWGIFGQRFSAAGTPMGLNL